jgi:hypothetical protein
VGENRTGPIASAHLFTFGSARDAARSLARDRHRVASVPGLRFARVVFVGSRRSECMNPGWIDPRRQLAMCLWDDEAALERFRDSPLGRTWREQTNQFCEVRAQPFRAHGAYRGAEPLAGLGAQAAPAGPVAFMTFANMPARQLRYFYRGLRPATKVLHASEGLVAAVGGPERLGRGAMTFTLWQSLDEALRFSYRSQPHRGLVKSVHERKRFIDSMFLRLAPYAAEGAWFPWSRFALRFARLAELMRSAPAPGPPATTPPGPAAPSPTA